MAGTASNPFQESFSDFGLVRYNSDGGLDATFGDNGKVMTDFNSEFDDAWALTQQQDGRLVVAGQSEDSQERSDFALARYNANGELDATFGSDGRAKTDFFGFDDGVRAVALQNDGKIVAAGVANDVIEDQFQVYIAVARYDGVSFDICLQDDGNEALFQFNSMSGDYQFTNCIGVTIGGTGVISRRGSTITLQQNGPDRRVLVQIDGGVNKGTASVQLLSQRTTFTITDRNTLNNTCSCEAR